MSGLERFTNKTFEMVLILGILFIPLAISMGGFHETTMGHDEIRDGESLLFDEEDIVEEQDKLVFVEEEHESTASLVNESGEVVYFDELSDKSGDAIIVSVLDEGDIVMNNVSDETNITVDERVVFVNSETEKAYFYEFSKGEGELSDDASLIYSVVVLVMVLSSGFLLFVVFAFVDVVLLGNK